MKLVLASGSQRRRELLTMCGYDYEIIVSNADETIDENDPESFVRALSFRKAKEVFDRLFAAGRRDFAVIGSDTVVAFQKEGGTKPVIIGKPKDAKDAVRILSMLSGKTHRVFTGVSVIADIPDENAAAQCSIRKKAEIQTECSIQEKAEIQTECSITEVTFETLSPDEITDYVNSGDPLDKAGSYGIQGPFGMFVREIRGNYFTVIGMPIPVLYKMLKKIGILPHGFYERIE
ncbi:MAG: Maf family protein [Eubacteriales bacterium]|nr:Maf family protein [Eubacteriales bacterium]